MAFTSDACAATSCATVPRTARLSATFAECGLNRFLVPLLPQLQNFLCEWCPGRRRARTISQNVANTVMFMKQLIQRTDSSSSCSCLRWLPFATALCDRDRLARLRMRKDRGQHRAANATPVEDEMNWAVPQPRPGHTANVSHNLLETTNFIWHPNLKSRSFHIVSKFLRITKARVTLISLCSFLL